MDALLLILGCVFVFVVILHVIATRRERTGGGRAPVFGADPFQRLVLACLGDRAKAQRLLDFELRRDPNLLFDDAARRALERLTQDRSR